MPVELSLGSLVSLTVVHLHVLNSITTDLLDVQATEVRGLMVKWL